jgi:hypothetical protein
VPCFEPLDAWQTGISSTGKRALMFKCPETRGNAKPDLQVPCGRCLGCRLEYGRQWAMRCMQEASLHTYNCFVTLTYDQENLPENGTLVKRDLQLFFKRLRKRIYPRKIKYYAAGEYGEANGRPHYHACIFGWMPTDGLLIRSSASGDLYASRELDSIWQMGLTSFGSVTFESAGYVAGYATKKVTGEKAKSHYARVNSKTGEYIHLLPEFAAISTRPAIGKDWFDRFKDDIYPCDTAIMRGREMKPPRYFDRKMEEQDEQLMKDIKDKRIEYAKEHKSDCTRERLRERAKVAAAKLKLKSRKQI